MFYVYLLLGRLFSSKRDMVWLESVSRTTCEYFRSQQTPRIVICVQRSSRRYGSAVGMGRETGIERTRSRTTGPLPSTRTKQVVQNELPADVIDCVTLSTIVGEQTRAEKGGLARET